MGVVRTLELKTTPNLAVTSWARQGNLDTVRFKPLRGSSLELVPPRLGVVGIRFLGPSELVHFQPNVCGRVSGVVILLAAAVGLHAGQRLLTQAEFAIVQFVQMLPFVSALVDAKPVLPNGDPIGQLDSLLGEFRRKLFAR